MSQEKQVEPTKQPIADTDIIVDADIGRTSSAIDTEDQDPLTSDGDINKKEMYLCTVGSIYKVFAASSAETKGRKLLVTINEDNLIIKSQSAETPATYNLKLLKKTNITIFARTKSKQFIYNPRSHVFIFNTGIGPSGFNVSKGGHTGRQMRASGQCAEA